MFLLYPTKEREEELWGSDDDSDDSEDDDDDESDDSEGDSDEETESSSEESSDERYFIFTRSNNGLSLSHTSELDTVNFTFQYLVHLII